MIELLLYLQLQKPTHYDLDKLAYAIRVKETADCTTGVGASKNNCYGIRRGGEYVAYETPEDSTRDFKEFWHRLYGRFPTIEDAAKYSSPGAAEDWLKTVKQIYFNN
jgi:hypothetical protein